MITVVKKESDYIDFLKNKRVIFVGPGSILQGRGFGSFIDSFDVVIRTNHFPVLMKEDPSLCKDYGKKCSVLYTNMHYCHRHMPLPVELYKSMGFKWLCYKKIRPVDERAWKNIIKIRKITDISNYVQRLIKSDALMGSIILHDVVSGCPAEFFITGIDFFLSADENYGAYAPGYISEETQQENIRKGVGQGKGHNLKTNAQYMLAMHDQGYFQTHDFVLDKIKQAAECK